MTDSVIWDRFIRLFHWATVFIFVMNQFIAEDALHSYLGYTLFALLLARVYWGFYGSRTARFSSFWPTYLGIKRHLLEIKNQKFDSMQGHNPVGGMMILCLLLLLFLICISGWMMSLDAFWGQEWLQNTHELFADITLVCVVIHIVAVVIMSKVSSINLIKTMITGTRTKGR